MNKIAAALVALFALALATSAAAQAPAPSATAPDASVTILAEGFEGAWPGAGWTVTDLSNDGYDRKWGKDDFKPHTDVYSAWPAAAGAHRVDPATGAYPNNLNSRMVYGPFDLSDALSAKLTFWLWAETEADYDYLYLGSSPDGTNYNEESTWEGTLDWDEVEVDLTKYAGDPSVWVRWDFVSDFDTALAGPFIDDVTITKTTLDAPVVSITRSGSNINLDWPDVASAASYEVWRATNAPYFTPGATCAGNADCASVTASAWTHNGGSGSASTNYTYVVRSVSGAVKSKISNRVAEFDFTLVR